jgi:carboxylesterase
MWRGRSVEPLRAEQAGLLSPINQRKPGNHRALLLLHGFSSSPAVFRFMLPELTMYDAVVCPVLPGHADSIDAFSRSKATDWLSTAEAACQDLLRDYQQVDVLGLSLGGLLACHVARKCRLNRLYLLAPALDLKTNVSLSLLSARLLRCFGIGSLNNRGGNLHAGNEPELAYRRLPLSSIIEILNLVKSRQFDLPDCPVDLFLGRYDQVVDSSAVARRFSNLPNATTHWLENSAHVLPLDGDREIIMDCIKSHQ